MPDPTGPFWKTKKEGMTYVWGEDERNEVFDYLPFPCLVEEATYEEWLEEHGD